MLDAIMDYVNRILSVFSTFTLTDFLDIALVAIVIYICVRILRETRAMQLAKGIAFMVVIYLIVNALQMEASSYIFRSIFSNILIIAVVIFAPEFRNILEQIGKGSARRSLKTIIHSGVAVELAEIENSIEAVIKACSNMSDNKTGALIAFEKDTLLGNIIDSGTVLNAKASRALIENIFYPKTPLHDGAMVIRNGAIYAAGCILPLTNKNVISSLGTRHRAAIGLSEESDAIVVVVSEETGAISVARSGVLKSNISDGDLRDILKSEFLPGGSSSDDKILARLVKRVRKNEK
ncbi:MAG: diadenylate cyclase CdaA [Eubacterium sp.]|nr:diadenylate cyclase CdaA [Eubacterium sp.]